MNIQQLRPEDNYFSIYIKNGKVQGLVAFLFWLLTLASFAGWAVELFTSPVRSLLGNVFALVVITTMLVGLLWVSLWLAFGEERVTSADGYFAFQYHIFGKGIRAKTIIPKSSIENISTDTVFWMAKGHTFSKLVVKVLIRDGTPWQNRMPLSDQTSEQLMSFMERERQLK
jgi:hypothetical protein